MNVIRIAVILFVLTMANSIQGQDWANLQRFQQANEQLEPSREGEERIVFMGNSITEGWVNISPSLFDSPHYINRGIGGQTTGQMKLRFWQDVIKLQPSKVVILAGINDIAQNQGYVPLEETAQNIFDMAELAKAQKIEVVICSVLPANVFAWRPSIYPADKVIELNKLLKAYSEANNCVYIDYYSEMVNDVKGMKEAYTYDGVHCTEAGYKKMEQILKATLSLQ